MKKEMNLYCNLFKLKNTNTGLKLTNFLREEPDNPTYSFNDINMIMNNRIKLLSKRLYIFIRDFDKERQYCSDQVKWGKKEVDKLFNEYYYVIKSYLIKINEEIEEQKLYNIDLQKQISSLRKEKGDLENFLVNLNSQLDSIEDSLGVNMQLTRIKINKGNISKRSKNNNIDNNLNES
jgi:hypothetical protein